MQFVAHALDKPGALARRQEALAAHRAYLDQVGDRAGVTVLLSGPLVSDDGETMCGSFFLIDAPDRATVEAIFAADPLASADVWQKLTITAVAIRQNQMGGGA